MPPEHSLRSGGKVNEIVKTEVLIPSTHSASLVPRIHSPAFYHLFALLHEIKTRATDVIIMWSKQTWNQSSYRVWLKVEAWCRGVGGGREEGRGIGVMGEGGGAQGQ